MSALLLLVLGCALPAWPEPTPTEAPRFPHAQGYAAVSAHGAEASALGVHTCAGCHSEGGAPSCTTCHPSFPHAEGWLTGHGGGAAGCGGCHADEGGAPSCTTCHGSYPHPEGFAAAGAHGALAAARPPVAACGPCHGEDLAGGKVGVGCADCHQAWPHPPGFTNAHGEAFAADAAGCDRCHATGEAWDGGLSGVACARCHSSYPHPPGYAQGHLPDAESLGEGVCMRCHARWEGPAAVTVSCASTCHGGAD